MEKNQISKKPLVSVSDVADRLLASAGIGRDGEVIVWDYEPVNIVQFIEDPYYLNLKESVRQNVMDDLVTLFGTDPKQVKPNFNYAIFSEAVGTGKTFRMGCAAVYQVYKLLCLRDPIRFFNTLGIQGQPKLARDSKLAVLLMAVTAENARKVIYTEVGNKIANSPWFREHYPPEPHVKTERQFDPTPSDYRKRTDRVYKNIFIIPGSSSEYSAVGYNVILAVIDEVTLFEDIKDASLTGGASVNDQAEIVYSTLNSRIKSRFLNHGLLVTSGNPKHTEDFLERHIADSEGRKDTYIISRRPVWKSTLPDFDPDATDRRGKIIYPHFWFHLERLEVVKEQFRNLPGVIPIPMQFFDDFKRTPEVAKRDLAGYPTSAVGRVISDPDLVFKNVNSDRDIPIDPSLARPSPPKNYIEPWFKRRDLAWHGIHIDLAEVKDKAAMCLSHPVGHDENGEVLIYTDLILTFQGSPDDPVNPEEIYKWILFLRDELNIPIGKITADKHQSSYLLLQLRASGFETGILSTDTSNDPYDELIQAIRSGRLDYYNHSLAIQELTNLERRKGKYDHSRSFSKDASDAWAGSVYNSIRLAEISPPPPSWEDASKRGSRAIII